MPPISVILNGAEVPSTARRPMHPVMQGYGDHMDDAEVAALATFLRKAWGNATGPVVAADVAKVRQHAAH